MRWIFGFILIVIGVAFLGNALSWWSASDLALIWKFWPILLILIGVSILTRRWRWGAYLTFLIFLLSLTLVFFSIAFNKPVSIKNVVTDLITSNISESPFDSTKKATITIDSGALELNIKSSGAKLVDGSLKSNAFSLSTSRQDAGDTANINIKTERIDDGAFWHTGKLKNEMDLSLSDSVPINLIVNSGASKLNLNLSNIILSGFLIKSGASDLEITIGDKVEQKANLSVDSGASDIKLRIPKDVGAELVLSAAFSSKHIDGFDEINSKLYRSKDFDKSAKQISVNISSGISSINVERY